MFRYIAMAWDARAPSDCQMAMNARERILRRYPSWCRVLDGSGVLVVCCIEQNRPEHCAITLLEQGVVLGTLFRRRPLSASTRVQELSSGEIDDIARSRGRSIVASHWGSYVLILRDPDTDASHVLRGPLSSLPCYYAVHERMTLFFSRADDFVALGLVRFSINWPRVRAQIAMSDYLNGETGLNEVRALDAGSCISVRGAENRIRSYWTPRSARWDRAITDFSGGAEELRCVGRACIGSWASSYGSILTSLSGGLDSSIVLGCLARSPTRPRLVCLNFYSPLLGDERVYARSMAERFGAELLERERAPSLDLRVVLGCNRTVSPVLHFTGCDSEPAAVRVAKDLGADAIFNGELGDDLFGSGVREEVLVEYLRLNGLGPSVFRVAFDYALLRQVSVWRALRLAMRYRRLELHRTMWSGDRYARRVLRLAAEARLASREAVRASEQDSERFVHPWSRDAAGMPEGKRQLVCALQLVTSTSYESPFTSPDDPPKLSPLVSQPLVELGLVIPTHFHIQGGLNRALAREAFRMDLSEAVLHRGSGKGGPEQWLRLLVDRNREFLRELLLDGMLVRERLLDRDKLERILSKSIHKATPGLTDVIAQMYVEAWLRRWTKSGLHAVA